MQLRCLACGKGILIPSKRPLYFFCPKCKINVKYKGKIWGREYILHSEVLAESIAITTMREDLEKMGPFLKYIKKS